MCQTVRYRTAAKLLLININWLSLTLKKLVAGFYFINLKLNDNIQNPQYL